MKKLHCDYFQLDIKFKESQFNKKAFLADVKSASKNNFYFNFGSRVKSHKEHAHSFIMFDKADSTLRLTYSVGSNETDDVREPYLDNVASWIGSFFKDEDLVADVMGVYEYDNHHESRIQLNYPLLMSSELYEGSKISGHDITFPSGALVNGASVTVTRKQGVRIFLYTVFKLKLVELDIYRMMERVGVYANELVTRKENSDARSKDKN